MASLRIIRRSLRSIQNTKQIMRAMQLVSGSKLKRAQAKLLQAREVLEFLDGLLQRVLAATPTLDHPLCATPSTSLRVASRAPFGSAQDARPELVEGRAEPRDARRDAGESLLVLFTSDAGLCGSYNVNLIQLAESHLRRDSAKRTKVIYIGKKGYRYFTKRGYQAEEAFVDLAGRPNLAKAETIGRSLIERFLSGHVGAITLLYSRFVSSTVYRPTVDAWLPIQLSPQSLPAMMTEGQAGTVHPGPPVVVAGAGSPQSEYIFEPSARRVFEDLLPRWALAKFQCLMLEAFTSEHSARMIAMKNATDNAEEIMSALTLQRNKLRQAAITKEISEIVGTAEALR